MASNESNILDKQALLSEQLQLLRHLDYVESDSESYMEDIQHRCSRDRDDKKALQILDTIALALTTGKPGEIFATAFDKNQTLTLVLAKSDPVTPEDRKALDDLITMIATARDVRDAVPYLFSRCRKNIEKRITKMLQTLVLFSHDLDVVFQHYTSLPIDQEFPNSAEYRKDRYQDTVEPEFPDMIKDCVDDIRNWAQQCDFQDTEFSMVVFYRLVMVTEFLRRSRLLLVLVENNGPGCLYSMMRRRVERLKRRLNKVCQYWFDVDSLISRAKRLIHGGFNCRWVDDMMTGTGETALELVNNPFQAKSFSDINSNAAFSESDIRIDNTFSITQEDFKTLRERFPKMEKSWLERRSIQTRVHPEIRIALALGNNNNTLALCRPQPIGCSQRTCLCCTLWFEEHNQPFCTTWYMSRSRGRPRADWALPGWLDNEDEPSATSRTTYNEFIRKIVSQLLTKTLRSLLKKRTPYEEELEATRKRSYEYLFAWKVGHGVGKNT